MINERFVKLYDKFGAVMIALIVFFTTASLFWESDFKPMIFGYPKPNIEVTIFCLCSAKHILWWVLNITWSLLLLRVVDFKYKQRKPH